VNQSNASAGNAAAGLSNRAHEQPSLGSIRIGPYVLPNCLALAPMAGVTDRPFRQLCRRWGAGLAVSEMVSCNSLLWGSEKTQRRADHAGEAEPRSVQIVGADPGMMAEAARYNADRGAQIIDINMGCPAKKICNVLAGSALLRDERLVASILEAVVAAVTIPVTLKIRTGWDRTHRNGVRIARIAQEAGVQAVAVHGRTRACGFSGEAEYDCIRAIKQEVRIPVFANGDITTAQKARWVLEYTGADGVMIGRAAQGRPWLFRSISRYLATGEPASEPSPAEVRDTMADHLQNLYAFYGEQTGVHVARKHLSWYSKGRPGGAVFRQVINRIESAEEQRRLTREFLEHGEQPPMEDLAA
jgi:tRNA-dihydrouridine synthase B